MIGTPLTIKNHDTGEEIVINDHVTDPKNVIALQVFPTFETDVRAQNIPRQGAHGEFRMPYYYSGMSIVLSGVIAGESEENVWDIKKTLDSVMRLSRSGYAKDADGSVNTSEILRRNECTNPSGAVNTSGWTTEDATLAISGAKSIKATMTSASGTAGIKFVANAYPKTIGESYGAGITIKNTTDDVREFTLDLIARNGGGGSLDSDTESITLEAGEERRIELVIDELPEDTADVLLQVIRNAAGADTGDTFEVSKVILTPDVDGYDLEFGYFDGDTTPLTLAAYGWLGTSGASASAMYPKTLPSMSKNTVRISFTNPLGKEVFIDATPIKVVSYDRPLQQTFKLNFQVILRANFPVLLINKETPEVLFGEIGSITEGLKLPTEVPFNLGTEFVENPITVNVDEPSFAIVRMYGADNGVITNPTITNLTNGTTMKVRRSITGADKFFVVDGVTQRVYDQDGVSVQQFSEGGFITLEQGENVLVYTADAITSI